MKIDHLLWSLGYCKHKSLVKQWLKVNNVTARYFNPNKILNPAEDVVPSNILINGNPLPYIPPVTIIMNKPSDYVCSRERDVKDAKIVFDLLPIELSHNLNEPLSVAGRLDKDSTGLILLTQDGEYSKF